MKTPRVNDFDPKAQAPKLASPLDTMPVIQPPQKPAAHEPVRRPDPQTPRPLDATVPRPLGVQTPRTPDPKTPGRQPSTYDLEEKAEERQTLRLTEAEFRKLGAVQGMLGEQLGVKKVEKNDILRCGLHALVEDYEKRGDQSELVRRLRKKYH